MKRNQRQIGCKIVWGLLMAMGLGLASQAAAQLSTNWAEIARLPLGIGEIIYDAARDRMYATVPASNAVAVLEAQTGRLLTNVFIGSNPQGLTISADGSRLFVANSGGTVNGIGVLDLNSFTRSTFNTSNSVWSVFSGLDHRLYALAGNGIYVLNDLTGNQLSLISIYVYSGKISGTPDRTTLFYGEYGLSPSDLTRIVITNPVAEVGQSVQTGGNGQDVAVSYDNQYVVHPNGSPYSITLYSAANLATIGAFNTGPYPRAAEFDRQTRYLYAHHGGSAIKIFDVQTFLQVGQVATPGLSTRIDMALDASGLVLFIGTGSELIVMRNQQWSPDQLRARSDGGSQVLWRGLPGSKVDGQNSLWTMDPTGALQTAASFGPYAGWTVADMLVSRQANTPHLVWKNTSGAISIWNFNSSGTFQTAQSHGPFTGWSYYTSAISPTNNEQWVLWKHTTGQVALWRLNSNSVYQSSVTMGPFTDWNADELAISPADGKLRLLWKYTDGSVSLWRLSNTGGFEAANTFGPFAGWTAQTLTLGPVDNKVRILWENTSGAIAVWRLTTSDGYEASTTYGPFAGWLTLGMVMRPDNKLQLPWDRTADHAFSLWRLSNTEGFEAAPSYGPYAGWQVFGGDVDGANKSHLLWRKTDGAISLWRLSPTGALENTANYGPY